MQLAAGEKEGRKLSGLQLLVLFLLQFFFLQKNLF